jgi:hypothetical protein
MDESGRSVIVARLADAFGQARDVTPAPGQPLHVVLPEIVLPEPWTPTRTRALTVWAEWPQSRPAFYIDAAVTGETGQPPRNPNGAYLLGETWNGFSFSFAWSGEDPVRAVRIWLTRFEVERT